MSLYSETFSTLKPFKRRPTYDLLIAFKGNKTKLLFFSRVLIRLFFWLEMSDPTKVPFKCHF